MNIKDLFMPVVSEDRLHPNFKMIMHDKAIKKVLKRWLEGFVDRDNKFIYEFQTDQFNSMFWELYLHALFKKMKARNDGHYNRPDFCLKRNGQSFVIEAVTTNAPSGELKEYERLEAMQQLRSEQKYEVEELHETIVALATERISNSIVSKYNLYLKSYSKLDHVKGKPFVLAVGAYEQPFFFTQGTAAIQRVLYGQIEAKYLDNGEPFFKYDNYAVKRNGSKIPIGLFNNEDYKHISAVLFSPVATEGKARVLSTHIDHGTIVRAYRYNDFGTRGNYEVKMLKDYQESLENGVSVFLNPFAEVPLDRAVFDFGDIALYEDTNYAKVNHGFVYGRQILRFTQDDHLGKEE